MVVGRKCELGGVSIGILPDRVIGPSSLIVPVAETFFHENLTCKFYDSRFKQWRKSKYSEFVK